MSITIGVYEFFAYTIPGYFYLAVAGVLGMITGWFDMLAFLPHLDALTFVLVSVGAYGLGLLMDPVAKWSWEDPFKNEKAKDRAWSNVWERNENLSCRLEARQWPLMQAHARVTDAGAAAHYERFQATSIMLRNVSFSLVLAAITLGMGLLLGALAIWHLVSILLLMLFAILSIRQSRKFSIWAYETVFDTFLAIEAPMEDFVKLENPADKS